MASGRIVNHREVADFIRALRERRMRLGLTRHQIAGQIGVSRSAITRIETSKRAPHLGIVFRLAEALDMKIRLDPRM